MDKEEIVNFLFWLQENENRKLMLDWFYSNASNRYVATQYIKSLATETHA